MTIWSNEIRELDKLYLSFRGHLPDIVKEMEQLIKTDDANVVMLYSRRCLEVIITDLCETELQRPRKTEPLKGIIDKLNSEEKVPSYIIASMHSLNSMATFGAHPKDFDQEQVKPVLNNLAIVIKWYLKYKDFQVVSKTEQTEHKPETVYTERVIREKPVRKKKLLWIIIPLAVLLAAYIILVIFGTSVPESPDEPYSSINAYSTVLIGDQLWMAENLRTTKFNDGTPIPLVKDEKEWENLTTPAYCWYENDKSQYWSYGILYNWYAVNTGKLCPVGWHVPTDEEWTRLTFFLGDSVEWINTIDTMIIVPQVAAIKLKEAGNDHWLANDSISSNDETGFKALPGGFRNVYGYFFGIGEQGKWWTSDEYDLIQKDAKSRELFASQNGVTALHQYKQTGMSVRCIEDKK